MYPYRVGARPTPPNAPSKERIDMEKGENAKYAAKKYDEFRDYMVKRIDQRKYDLRYFTDLFYTIRDYVEQGKPMSVARMILMSGMDRHTFYAAKNGKYDDCLPMYLYKEQIEESDAEMIGGVPMHNGVILLPPSELIEKMYLLYEMQITEEMLESKNMPQVTSRIFVEKSVFGYTDQPNIVNQTNVLNISDSAFDLAEKMLP